MAGCARAGTTKQPSVQSTHAPRHGETADVVILPRLAANRTTEGRTVEMYSDDREKCNRPVSHGV